MNHNYGDADIAILVENAKNGDHRAFEDIHEYFVTPLFRFIYRQVRNRTDADDLTQTTFLKAWDALPKYRNQGVPFGAWLYRIARNTVIDHWKKKKDITFEFDNDVFINIRDESETADATILKKEHAEEMQRCINILNETQREIIILKFFDDCSNREIAERTGKSEVAVRQILCRALRQLRDAFKNRKNEK